MQLRVAVFGVAAAVVLGGGLVACTPRADLLVTKAADTNDGTCDRDCSLREAVVAANAAAGPDVIRVPQGFYSLTRVGANEDGSVTGDLDVRGDLVIEGASDEFTITGQSAGVEPTDRILDVHSGMVEVRRARLADGRTTLGSGGIVRNNGALTLVDVNIEEGEAESSGGGIASGTTTPNASLTLRRTTVTSNRNTEEGAGIISRGRLRIEDSTISGNHGGPGYGMGVYNGGSGEILNTVVEFNGTRASGGENCGGGIANGGTLSVRGSRITNNGGESGGGILNRGGTLTVVATQIRYNRSSGSGAGIANDGGRVLLDAATVTGNEGDYDRPQLSSDCPSDEFDEGGGLYNSPDGSFELRGSTVAFNESGLGQGNADDCLGTFVDRGGNTIGNRSGCELTLP